MAKAKNETSDTTQEQPDAPAFPRVTRDGYVVITEFADGTVMRNAVGATS